ncbi:MAG: UbiA prenyltransferase family protein [Thermoplasmata archaeon]|nr:MAG: UbiA prenyltransferase family protein [Thermoplasmata archaeon]
MKKDIDKEKKKKTGRLPRKMRGLLELIRPFTLIAPFFGGITGALMALSKEAGLAAPYIASEFPYLRWDFPFLELFWGAITLVIVNAASNTLNQVYDYDIDKINKPYRPLPQKIFTKDEALTMALVLYLVTLWRVSLLNRSFATLVLIIMLITIFYSIPPLRFKKRFLISNISIALARGLLGFVAAWSIFDKTILPWEEPTPWVIGLLFGIYLMGAVTTKDFTDIKGDKKYGMNTLPVVLGMKNSILFSAPFFVLPFILIPIGIWRGHLIPETMVISIFIIWGVYIIFLLIYSADTIDTKFENSPVWKHMYLMLVAMQLSFCVIYILY